MRRAFGAAHASSAVLAAAMLAQSALGLLVPGAYRDAAWIRATWYGNDWVTLAVAVPALAGTLLLVRRGSVRARLLWLGLLGYGVYNYAFYALGAALNAFFPLYVALLVLAAATLRLALRDTDAAGIARAFRRRTPVRVVGAYLVIVASGLAAVWLAFWAAYAFAGRPTPVEPEAFRLVAALDLTLIVPVLAVGGGLLWRRRPWGLVVATAAAVQGALYLLVLAVNSLVAVARGLTPAPGEAPLWGTLCVLTAGAAALLLANVRPEGARHAKLPTLPSPAVPTRRSTRRLTTRLLALAGALIALLAGFLLVVRPWYLQWGATDDEARRPLAGDQIIPTAAGQETRAITIRAPVERVWPWLAQLGQDRGGFYSFDLLENLVGCEMPTEDVLRPDRQTWRIGDRLWMYPPDKAGGIGFATLRTYIPGRALAFATSATGSSPGAEDGSWAFVLQPVGDTATRLLVRGRGAVGRLLLGVAFDRAVFEPIHFVMERRMMVGLEQLVEEGDRHRRVNHLHVLLWTVTFTLVVTSAVLVLRRDAWRQPLAGFVAAAVVFQVLTLAQPPVALGAALVAAVGGILWLPLGARRLRTWQRGARERPRLGPAAPRTA